MIQWYSNPWVEVVKMLESNLYSGLDDKQILLNRNKYGSNKILIPKPKGVLFLAFGQLKELWIVMTIISSFFFLYSKEFLLSAAALAFAVINSICIAFDKYNKEKDLKELQKLNLGYARTIRQGRTLKIPVEELVVGDIVIVGKGESVPADLRLIESDDLRVNETSVTGEKFIAEKYETKIDDRELSLSDMKNILFKASIVTNGSATGIVIAAGMKTQVANIAKLSLKENFNNADLNRRICKIVNIFGIFILLCLVLNIGMNLSAKDSFKSIISSSAIFMTSTLPQGIILSITIVAEILFKIMKRKSIIFKDMPAIEILSSVSSICTDKIGAFSENNMEVSRIYTNNQNLGLPNISFLENEEVQSENENFYRLMSISLLCNDTRAIPGSILNPKDDLQELALVNFALKNGMDKRKLEKKHERILNIPFDSERRIMTTINRVDKNYRANVKGAVDSLIARCTHIMKNGVEVEITEEDIDKIKDSDISMSGECLSVIGFAYRNFNYEPSLKENIESNLVFVGLIGFENKLKEDAGDSINKCRNLFIKPIMITEDNKLTALAVGKKLGMISKLQQVLSGVEIDNMTNEEFERIAEKINVFSKIGSSNKLKIVKTLKSYGYITAITGSKLTDLPALKNSDIGITNCERGMLKRLSDIFLRDISFKKLLNTIEDSRKIVSVLKKIVVYITSCSISMLIFLMLIYMGRYRLSSIVWEAMWFNYVIMILSSAALIVQYDNESVYLSGSVVDIKILKEKLGFAFFNGILMGVGAFGVFILAYGINTELARISAFAFLNICAVLFSYSFSNTMFFKKALSNIIILINLVLQLLVLIYIGFIQVVNNITSIRNLCIFIGIWFIISIFNKFDKDAILD